VSARRDFFDYRDGLRQRRKHGGPPITDDDLRRLLALRDAWQEDYRRFPGGDVPGVPGGAKLGRESPPTWATVEAEFAPALGTAGEAPVESVVAPERSAKSYDARVVVPVIRLAAELHETPCRAVRDRWYHERRVPDATTTLFDHVLGLMGGKPLSPARRRQWDQAARRMAADGSVTLDELTQRLG
jgi:hypothetical protein